MSAALRRAWLPSAVVLLGVLLASVLALTGPEVAPRPVGEPRPFVRVEVARPEVVSLRVRTHGTVEPRTESELVPEVSGPVIWRSPDLVSGGFFSRGEPLLRIDPIDAEVELERSRAQLARAQAEAETARSELGRREGLAARDAASAQELDRARRDERVARANVREATAQVAQAEKSLERTVLRAPYHGRVRDARVDLGQFVSRGTSVATLYAIDHAEVRLPIPDGELAFLDLPLLYRSGSERDVETESNVESEGAPRGPAATTPPDVWLRARFAGAEHTWAGRLVRTEGELDPKTRMVHVVARVTDPYARQGDRPPLAVGLFVDAEIVGRTLEAAIVLPRTALRDADHVWVVDAADRLRERAVDVARADGESVVVTGGLEAGERVCVSPPDVAVDGMRVRTEATAAAPGPPAASESSGDTP